MCITSLASLVITEVVKESDIKNHITPSIEVPKEDDLTVCVWSTVYRHIPTAWIIYGFFACKYDFLFQVFFANFEVQLFFFACSMWCASLYMRGGVRKNHPRWPTN